MAVLNLAVVKDFYIFKNSYELNFINKNIKNQELINSYEVYKSKSKNNSKNI